MFVGKNGLNFLEGVIWKKYRWLIMFLFYFGFLSYVLEVIIDKIGILIKKLKDLLDDSFVEVYLLIKNLVFDIISEVVFGYDLKV